MPFGHNHFVSGRAGNEKFRSDKRQFAGLLFGASICACFFPMATLSTLVGPDGSTPNEGVPLWRVIAGVCVIAIGLSGMATGYLALVHDYSNKFLTGWVLVIVQTAWIAYITDMTNVGKMAASGMAFGLDQFNGTEGDVWFVGACGILGIFSYGFMFLGSLAFFSFSLYAYQAGKPGDRAAGYYRGRMRVYSLMVFIAGLAQLMLGAYTLTYFSSGPIVPPVGVAMFTVTFPEISVTVGSVYIINGLWGVMRTFSKPTGRFFQMGIAFQWLCTVSLMILVQIAYLPGGMFAPAAPSRACLTLGAHVMPAFLDYKMRTTPEEIDADYYGDLGMAQGETRSLVQNQDDKLEQGHHQVAEQAYLREPERAYRQKPSFFEKPYQDEEFEA